MIISQKLSRSLSLLFIVLGLVAGWLITSAVIFYFTTFIAGIITGRVVYLEHSVKSKKTSKTILPIIILVLILVITFIGPFSKTYNILLFFIASGSSYYLHKKKIIGSFKNEPFVK